MSSFRCNSIIFVAFSMATWILVCLFRSAMAEGLIPSSDFGFGFTNPDSAGYFRDSLECALEIQQGRWKNWQVLACTHPEAGIIAAIFSITGAMPELVPIFNSVIHALSGLALFILLAKNFSRISAICASILFILNPTTLEWTANFLRDGFFILANYLTLIACIELSNKRKNRVQVFKLSIIGAVGLLLVYYTRPYWIYFTTCLTFVALITASFFLTKKNKRHFQGKEINNIIAASVLFGISFFLCASATEKNFAGVTSRQNTNDRTYSSEKVPLPEAWIKTSWMPGGVDKIAEVLAIRRNGMLAADGKSSIFPEVRLHSIYDIARFIPMAFSAGILAPFPQHWTGKGTTELYGLARKVLGILTVFGWFCILGIISSSKKYGRNSSWWFLILAGLSGCMILGMVFSNLGTLVRVRYGLYMLLISLGFAGWLDIAQKKISQSRNN